MIEIIDYANMNPTREHVNLVKRMLQSNTGQKPDGIVGKSNDARSRYWQRVTQKAIEELRQID